MVNSRSIHRPFRFYFLKWWFRQMDSRMRIKKPAGNADFLAMIKDFDLVFWNSKSNSFPIEWMLKYSIFNVIIVTITVIIFDISDYTLYFCIFPFISQDDNCFNVIQTTFDATVTETESRALRPPQQCRGLGAATTRPRVYLVTAGAEGLMADSNRWLMESSITCRSKSNFSATFFHYLCIIVESA